MTLRRALPVVAPLLAAVLLSACTVSLPPGNAPSASPASASPAPAAPSGSPALPPVSTLPPPSATPHPALSPSPSPRASPSPAVDPTDPASILRRVLLESFNDTRNKTALRSDNYLILGWVADALPLSEAREKLREGDSLLMAHPGLERFSPDYVRAVNRSYRPGPGDVCEGAHGFGCMVLLAMHCDILSQPERLRAEMEPYRLRGGYAANHLLLSWWFLEQNGCITKADAWREKNTTAYFIASWTADRFGDTPPRNMDVLAESVGMLRWLAHRPDLVDPKWQGWIRADLAEKVRAGKFPVHETLLEIWAVA